MPHPSRLSHSNPPFSSDDTATTAIYTLSLHDALPISPRGVTNDDPASTQGYFIGTNTAAFGSLVVRRVLNPGEPKRSEEHTSELQSQFHLVCRLLLEKKKH